MSDPEIDRPIRTKKKNNDGVPRCKMCRSEIPKDCPYLGQGYCDCVKQFSRHTKTDATVDESTKNTEEKKHGNSENRGKSKSENSKSGNSNEGGKKESSDKKEESDPSKTKCYKCHFFGHVAKDCTTKICEHCKGRRHTTEQCKKNPENYCTKCDYFGHTSEKCKSKVCEECGKKGHTSDGCWKKAECGRCNKTGHPTDRCKIRCMRCNRRGHSEGKCDREVKCWICKSENLHAARNCPNQKTMECRDCGEIGHATRFCNSEYMFKNRPY